MCDVAEDFALLMETPASECPQARVDIFPPRFGPHKRFVEREGSVGGSRHGKSGSGIGHTALKRSPLVRRKRGHPAKRRNERVHILIGQKPAVLSISDDLSHPWRVDFSRKRVLKDRWDHMEIPRLWTRVSVVFGNVLEVPSRLTQSEVDLWASRLHDALDSVDRRAKEKVNTVLYRDPQPESQTPS